MLQMQYVLLKQFNLRTFYCISVHILFIFIYIYSCMYSSQLFLYIYIYENFLYFLKLIVIHRSKETNGTEIYTTQF